MINDKITILMAGLDEFAVFECDDKIISVRPEKIFAWQFHSFSNVQDDVKTMGHPIFLVSCDGIADMCDCVGFIGAFDECKSYIDKKRKKENLDVEG